MAELKVLLIEYFFIAIIVYIVLHFLNLAFYDNDQEIKVDERTKKWIYFRISFFWILEIPKIIVENIGNKD